MAQDHRRGRAPQQGGRGHEARRRQGRRQAPAAGSGQPLRHEGGAPREHRRPHPQRPQPREHASDGRPVDEHGGRRRQQQRQGHALGVRPQPHRLGAHGQRHEQQHRREPGVEPEELDAGLLPHQDQGEDDADPEVGEEQEQDEGKGHRDAPRTIARPDRPPARLHARRVIGPGSVTSGFAARPANATGLRAVVRRRLPGSPRRKSPLLLSDDPVLGAPRVSRRATGAAS